MSDFFLSQLSFESSLNLLLIFVSSMVVLIPRFDFLLLLFLLDYSLCVVLYSFLLLFIGSLYLIIVTTHFFHPIDFYMKCLLLFLVCSVMRSIIFNYNNYKSIYRDTYKIHLQYIIKKGYNIFEKKIK